MHLVGTVSLLLTTCVLAACTAPEPVAFPEGPANTVSTEPADTIGPLRFEGTRMLDAEGREVQIHGINMVRKSAPFHVSPDEAGFDDNIARIRDAGFNAVRLGVWTASLMPSPGVIDQAYLDEVQRGVEALTAENLWVLLDFHQDVFTGLPEWATTPAAAALSDTLPGLESFWALAYFTPRSMRQWEDLYARVDLGGGANAVDLMGDGVAAVAQRFAGNPNVIGIDLLNEPWPGEAFLDCVAANCAGRYNQLQSIYEDYTAKVEAVAPDMLVWWTPFNWGPPFQNNTPPTDDDVALTYHSYCLGTDGGEPVQPPPAEYTLCGALYDGQTTDALALSRRWDTPVILGEFGASASPLNSTRLTTLADENRLSWMYWDDNYYRQAPEEVRTDLVRAYPQATAGEVTHQSFDPATGLFEMTYIPDHDIAATSTIVVPREAYPDGYDVAITDGQVTSDPDSGRLSIAAGAGADEVTVTVSRR